LQTLELQDVDYRTMFYELYTSKALLKLIRNHAAKLISVSKDLQTWTRSSYGTILLMVNTGTLKALRQCWLQYFDPKTSGDDRRLVFHNSASKANGHKSEWRTWNSFVI
jgi:hypothetical protein